MSDSLNFLLENGMDLDEVHRLMDHDELTVDQIAEAAKNIIGRGGSLTSATFATFAPQWEEPIPFDTIDTPSFPTESLPLPMSAFVESLAESTQTPEEMAGILSLGVLAAALQSKYEVEISPDWREPLCLYSVAIAPPGERKSAVISALAKPVYEYEAEQRELEAVEIAQNQTERALLERALQSAQAQATKKKGSFEAGRQEALELSAQLAKFKDKHPFRLLVDDTTPEKLVDLMDTQDGCITVLASFSSVLADDDISSVESIPLLLKPNPFKITKFAKTVSTIINTQALNAATCFCAPHCGLRLAVLGISGTQVLRFTILPMMQLLLFLLSIPFFRIKHIQNEVSKCLLLTTVQFVSTQESKQPGHQPG